MTKTETIAKLNDELRTTFNPKAGRLVVTQGFNALPDPIKAKFADLIQTFNAFSVDNDPNGEHDFGAVEHEGERVFWKIDYYDQDYYYHSEDASDPTKTNRVLTIMLAREW